MPLQGCACRGEKVLIIRSVWTLKITSPHYPIVCISHLCMLLNKTCLMEPVATTLGLSLVQSTPTIMYGMSASNIHKPQFAQNFLTCLFLLSLRHLSRSEWLVYWLPVNYRIWLKIAALTCKTLAACRPSYLYNLLQVYQPSRALRSSSH